MNTSANPADRSLFLVKGYATAITDTGHLAANPNWEYTAPGTPDTPKVVDYYFRAVHDVTLASKQLVKSLLPRRHDPALLLRWLLQWRENGPHRSFSLPSGL